MHNPGRVRSGPAAGAPDPASGSIRGNLGRGIEGFPLGRIVATPNALAQIPDDDIHRGLQRHRLQDWGIVAPDDHAANDQALQEGTRILSVYRAANGITFWIITEADRSATTVLLPEDY